MPTGLSSALIDADERIVRFFDPYFSVRSPSMRGIVLASPFLIESGWRVVAHCREHDNVQGVEIDSLGSNDITGISVSTEFSRHDADVILHHFSTSDWARWQFYIPFRGMFGLKDWRDVIRLRIRDWIGFRRSRAARHLAVSDGVAKDIRQTYRIDCGILPNAFDSDQFSVPNRIRYRAKAREACGFSEKVGVFAFASTGHYRRKGFFEAAQMLNALREESAMDLRFLVVGGRAKTLQRLKRWLDQQIPSWRTWIHFTGATDHVGFWMSAADGFLFPSYSEAFGLVSLEAAALGLRLYLTPHHGREMIIDDRSNACNLGWDVRENIAILRADLEKGNLRTTNEPSIGRSLTVEQYAKHWDEVLRSIRAEKLARCTNSSGL